MNKKIFYSLFLIGLVASFLIGSVALAESAGQGSGAPEGDVESGAAFQEATPFPYYDLEVPIGSKIMIENIADYVDTVYTWLLGVVGSIVVVMIMYNALKWITAAGDQSKIGKAKEGITMAVIGLTIALLGTVILRTINPALVTLHGLVPLITVPEYGFECNPPSSIKSGESGRTAVTDFAKYVVSDVPVTYSMQTPNCKSGDSCQADASGRPAGDTCFDCSGFVSKVYSCAAGISIPQSTYAIGAWSGSTSVEKVSSYNELEKGGFYGWPTVVDEDGNVTSVGHVVLYMGPGQMCEVRGSKTEGGAAICRGDLYKSRATFFFNIKILYDEATADMY